MRLIFFNQLSYVIGVFMGIFAVAMMVPTLIDYSLGLPQALAFSQSILIVTVSSGFMVTANRPGGEVQLKNHQAFLLTTLVWVGLCFISAMPFYLSGSVPTVIDALFEATSGLTTTGSTVIKNLDYLSPGLHVWRSMLQWFGGIGIIVMALTVLPMLRVGGMQLYRNEFSDRSDKFLPRISTVTSHLLGIYISLTFCCAIAYYVAGMPIFETICHSLTTVSTGGFSVHNSSFVGYNSQAIECVAIVFMILGGGSLVLQVRVLRGDFSALQDQQLRGYAWVILVLILMVLIQESFENVRGRSTTYIFQYISILTTTGFVSDNYELWPSFLKALIWIVMCTGGCTGSTSGSIKIFRFQVIWQQLKGHLRQIVYPRAIINPKFNGRSIDESVVTSIVGFLTIFTITLVLGTLITTLAGIDLLTAFSGTLASVCNVGPGFNEVGPMSSYADLPLHIKALYSLCMLLGRLEFLTIILLLTPSFWEN